MTKLSFSASVIVHVGRSRTLRSFCTTWTLRCVKNTTTNSCLWLSIVLSHMTPSTHPLTSVTRSDRYSVIRPHWIHDETRAIATDDVSLSLTKRLNGLRFCLGWGLVGHMDSRSTYGKGWGNVAKCTENNYTTVPTRSPDGATVNAAVAILH